MQNFVEVKRKIILTNIAVLFQPPGKPRKIRKMCIHREKSGKFTIAEEKSKKCENSEKI